MGISFCIYRLISCQNIDYNYPIWDISARSGLLGVILSDGGFCSPALFSPHITTFRDRNQRFIKIKVKDGIITDVKFNTFGCGSAIATSSMATELIKGKKVEDALELSNKAVVEALDGLPAHKIHCSVLAEEAVAAAVKDYYDRNGIAYDPELFSKKLHDCESCAE